MNINILDFLMENDVFLHSNSTGLSMTANEMYEFGGEFVVYDKKSPSWEEEVYRGLDFEKAVKVLNGDI